MQLREMIRLLSAANGPSGFEDAVHSQIFELLSPYVDEISTDAMGNVIAVRRCGRPDAKRLMLNAHLDEIGLIVTGIEKGFLRFSMLGGIDRRMLPARQVMVLADTPLFGVIDTMPPHILSGEEMDKSIAADKLFIDIGMSESRARELVKPGTPVVFAGGCDQLGEHMLYGKALDDRSCVAIIIKAMELLRQRELSVDVVCLIAAQKEVGLRGATAGAYAVNADYAITLDVTHAHTPDAPKEETCQMGKGPVIALGPNMNKALTGYITDVAGRHDIEYQYEVLAGRSGTDAWAIQISREGVCTALVSLPLKYMHSPVETIDMRDAEAIVKLLVSAAAEFTGEEDGLQ